MITIKSPEEISLMRKGGALLSQTLHHVAASVEPGRKIAELDALAYRLLVDGGGTPAFLGYAAGRGVRPYPATLCVSVNDEVVHGIGTRDIAVQEGDIVGLDIGVKYGAPKGLYTDMAITVPVGKVSEEASRLIATTKAALERAIAATRPGVLTTELSKIIQRTCEGSGFSVVRDLTGHGIGYALHEEPPIFCYENPRVRGVELKAGMVICIEPMVCAGKWRVVLDDDQWTIRTADGSRSAHFEHTIAVTEKGHEILTAL